MFDLKLVSQINDYVRRYSEIEDENANLSPHQIIMYHRKKHHIDIATMNLQNLEENSILRKYVRDSYLPYFGIKKRIRAKRAGRNMECMIEYGQ